jgi:SNF2 family DNA or RNA helicase
MWDGRDTQATRTGERRLLACRDLRILVINIEALATSERAKTLAYRFLATSRRRMIVVDESTLIKNWEAGRTGTLCRLGTVAEYRRIASGNPTPNSPLDLWGQFMFLGRGRADALGYSSFYGFRARYAVLAEQQTFHWVRGREGLERRQRTIKVPVAYRNLEELQSIVSRHSYRVRKEECLDLPPKIYEMREVELTVEQRRIYEDLRKVAVAQLEGGGEVTASMVIGQLSKMHQVLCGSVIDDEGVEREIKNNRMPQLLEVLEESGAQTIVWCAYQANVRAVCRAIREERGERSVVEYYGPTSNEDRAIAISRFQGGDAHYFVGTPHTGGRGNTLTAARSVVYFSNTFDLEHRVQSEDRAHRIGQHFPVTYVDLVVRGSIDERIIRALRAKINVASTIMKDGYREWLI